MGGCGAFQPRQFFRGAVQHHDAATKRDGRAALGPCAREFAHGCHGAVPAFAREESAFGTRNRSRRAADASKGGKAAHGRRDEKSAAGIGARGARGEDPRVCRGFEVHHFASSEKDGDERRLEPFGVHVRRKAQCCRQRALHPHVQRRAHLPWVPRGELVR